MNKFYAQLDANNIVEGVMQTHGVIDAANMIEIPGYDVSLLSNEYDPTTGTFTAQSVALVAISAISTQAFFRSLTNGERSALRPVVGGARAKDLKEDLERDATVVLDAAIRTLFEESGIFSTTRIDELMNNGS